MLEDEIAAGESNRLEFKEQKPKEAWKYLRAAVAMANTQGGRIVFGVADDRRIVGVDGDPFAIADSVIDEISRGCSPQLCPSSYVCTVDDRSVVVIEIPLGVNRPYYLTAEGPEEGVYVRIAASNRRASAGIIKELTLEGERRSFDALDYLEEGAQPVAAEAIARLCQLLSEKSQRTIVPTDLVNMGLLRDTGKSLIASRAFMLLTDNPYPHARVQCARFRGLDMLEFADRKELTGSILDQVDETVSFVMNNVRLASKIEGLYRRDIPELPIAAVREIVINAIVHRSYSITSSPTFVAVFDDRVEITSPGMLPLGMTIDGALSGHSNPRNAVLARFFREAKLTEGWGSGLSRAFLLCTNSGLQAPVIQEIDDSIRVTIFRDNAQHSVSVASASLPLTDLDNLVLDYLEANPRAKSQEVAVDLKCSMRTARRSIDRLKEKHLLIRRGPNRSSIWIVVRHPL